MAKKREKTFHTKSRFKDRDNKEWEGPIVDYKELDLLKKFLTNSNKIMTRKRAGTSAAEQRAIKNAVKYARYMALLPYKGT